MRMRLPYCRAGISSRELGPKKGVKRVFSIWKEPEERVGLETFHWMRGHSSLLAECHRVYKMTVGTHDWNLG